jgi:hypothetical protein
MSEPVDMSEIVFHLFSSYYFATDKIVSGYTARWTRNSSEEAI